MKLKVFGALVVALAFWLGHSTATEYARVSIISGPYSDDYGPALQAIEEARKKIQKGDSGVLSDLQQAEYHLQKAQSWTRVYLGRKNAAQEQAERTARQ
jgi:hypothetical protein